MSLSSEVLRAPGLLVEARYRGRTLCARVLSPASRRGFTVGAGSRADAPVDARYLAANDNHTLVERGAGGFVVHVPVSMRESTRRTESGLSVAWGEVIFDISATALAPVLPRPWLPRGWARAARLPGAVALATLLLLVVLRSVPSDPHALSLDDVGRTIRLASARVIPPVLAPAPVRGMKPSLRADARARASGPSGDAGRPHAPPVDSRRATKGTERLDASTYVHTHTLLSVLDAARSSVVESVFARAPALGSEADEVLGNMKGTTIADALGAHGLGQRGTGTGGADTGQPLIGDSEGLRIPGLRHGSGGPGARGHGLGALGPRHVSPTIEFTPPLVRGSLDREIVRRVVRQHLNEVRYCYEQALARKPALAGRVVAHFSIAPNGVVLASALQSSTLGDATVESCIVTATRRWAFPQPQGGGLVTVQYPFQFAPAGG
jgi:TonB family protein